MIFRQMKIAQSKSVLCSWLSPDRLPALQGFSGSRRSLMIWRYVSSYRLRRCLRLAELRGDASDGSELDGSVSGHAMPFLFYLYKSVGRLWALPSLGKHS